MNLFRSPIRVLGVVLTLVVLATSCGGDASVAEVADETLTQDAVVDLVDGIAASVGDQSLSADGLDEMTEGSADGTIEKQDAAGAITSWVRNEVWYAELAELDFAVTDADLTAAREELETIAQSDPSVPDLDTPFGREIIRSQALPALVAAYLTDVVGVEPVWPEQLCASHILVETEEEAAAALARVRAGEDFAAVATEVSTDASPGGDLGCLDPASLVPEFVEGARAIGGPGLAGPVESEFGWHVIDVRSFDSAPSEDPAVIQSAVFGTPEFAALQESVTERPVTIDPRYGTWDSESFSVVPIDG